MNEVIIAATIAILCWWASTVVVMYLDGLPRRTHGWTLAIASGIALFAISTTIAAARTTTIGSAYLAVGSAIAIWGWHELAFLTGTITGARRGPCDPDARGWQRMWQATATVLHHEIALAATTVLLAIATWQQPNRYGFWTFAGLWGMRLSAKLNLFLGARNLGEEFLPAHLHYLRSYMTQRRMNALFPLSIGFGAGAIALAIRPIFASDASPHVIVGGTLLTTMLALGVLEHLLLMIPAPSRALWSWGLRSHARAAVTVSETRSS